VVLDLKKAFYWSSTFHLTLFVFLVLSPYLPFQSFRVRDERITWITLPKGAGNILGTPLQKSKDLPKSTIEQQKKGAEEKPKKTDRMKMSEKKGEKPGKPTTETEEEKRMKEVLARISKEVGEQKPAVPAVVPEAAQIPETKPGGFTEGSGAGMVVPPDDPERLHYQLEIRRIITDQWIPPLQLRKMGLICILSIRMNEQGYVLETKWEQKSGNEAFDLSAERAVRRAAPLKPPPERLKWEALNEGLSIEFNPSLLDAPGG